MNPAAKLTAFAALLAVIFVAAFGAGRAVDPDRGTNASHPVADPMQEMTHR